jgi:hypothetical protein
LQEASLLEASQGRHIRSNRLEPRGEAEPTLTEDRRGSRTISERRRCREPAPAEAPDEIPAETPATPDTPLAPAGVREGRREPQVDGVRAWNSWFISLLDICLRQ